MAAPSAVIEQLIGSIADIGPAFGDVALRDPISAVLVAFGALFVFASVAVLGGLSFGALLDLVTPSGGARKPPREAR